ncbi:MAG TPA: hypothetical protein VFF69_06180 [Phycisphaerales bacterium]|nr:hypothetical protein [Phycisphaerales bacterium]
MSKSWSRQHPGRASLIGAGAGFVIGYFIFRAFGFLSPLVVVEARGEGKGGFVVEMAWLYLGIPLSIITGAMWPHTVGRVLERLRAR